MEITWFGLSCFRLTERGLASIVTDPFDGPAVGLPKLKLRSDIITLSHDAVGHNHQKAVSGLRHALTGPGEYEIGNVFITGVATPGTDSTGRKNVLFLFDFDGVKVAHLGDMAEVPSQTKMEALEQVNVLLVPVGGGSSLTSANAAELVSMLEPNLVVPMHYKLPDLKLDLNEIDRFYNEMGVSDAEEFSSLKVSSSSLPEETQVIRLSVN